MFEDVQRAPLVMRRLRDEIDRLFSGGVPEGFPNGLLAGAGVPPLNVREAKAALLVEVELPGLEIGDVEVLVVGNQLTLKGERKDNPGREASYHRRERAAGSFERSLRLPIDVDADKVEASMKDGVLTITLPKAEAAKPRRIDVKSAR